MSWTATVLSAITTNTTPIPRHHPFHNTSGVPNLIDQFHFTNDTHITIAITQLPLHYSIGINALFYQYINFIVITYSVTELGLTMYIKINIFVLKISAVKKILCICL
jgi:hypothetical protein